MINEGASPEGTEFPSDAAIFTWDWPNLRTDILVKSKEGEWYDPVEEAAKPSKKRIAISCVAYKLKPEAFN